MSRDVAFAAADFAKSCKLSSGLLFYGGEPLLERQLIYDVVDYTQGIKKHENHTFYYKMTTNGVLLDEAFLKFAQKVNLTIAFSHDGKAQDDCRLFPDGRGSFAVLEEKIPLLLQYQPYAVGMSVTDPSTVHRVCETVQYLRDKGFKYITVGVNYDRKAPWTREKLKLFAEQYRKMGELYAQWTADEEKFYLSSFDMKILSHLKGEKYHEDRRQMMQNQLSVAPDGKLYLASRHIDDSEFSIGDVFNGIDQIKLDFLLGKGATPPEPCQKCAIRTRCNYAYDTLRREGDEVVHDISPVQCAHERMLTPIVDSIAERLYNEGNALFMHKHYNELYPIMSLVEDRGA